LIALVDRVNREQISDPAVLLPDARERLTHAQGDMQRLIGRNVFLRAAAAPAPIAAPTNP
jgi:arabinosaccharide transport system substrate-binding protein